LPADRNAVHRLVDGDIARPAVFAIDSHRLKVRLRVADLLRRALDVQMFDGGLGDAVGRANLHDGRSGRRKIFRIE
jgi:hypothetical protein